MLFDFWKKKNARARFETTLTDWEKIFSQSKVNGAKYTGDDLPINPILWPIRRPEFDSGKCPRCGSNEIERDGERERCAGCGL